MSQIEYLPKKETYINYVSSIHKGILFFLLIISGNYIGNLLSCRIQDFFDTQIFAKHIIAFVSLYFFIILVEPELQYINPIKSLVFTIPIYFYFLILSKTEASIFLLVLLVLFLLTIVHLYGNFIRRNIDENKKISSLEEKFITNINLIKKIIIFLIVFLTIIGFLIYVGMKKTEYKNNFIFTKFLFGKIECSKNFLGDDPSISKSKILIAKHALNFNIMKIFILRAFK